MKERFFIKDITSEMILPSSERPVEFMTDEHGFKKGFNTYPEAVAYIQSLPKGYYQIEKVFIIPES